MDISWINTKVGFQMAEVIRKYLPKLTKALQDIAVYHAEIKSDDPGKLLYDNDINQIVDAIDIRKQENINLSHRVKELETMLKGYEPQYKDRLNKIDQKYHTLTEILRDKITRLETIIEERK